LTKSAPGVAAVGAGLAILLIQHAAVFFPSWSDENIHLYVADRIADGATLYGDIHSARPPLALVPLIVMRRLGVSPLLAARAADVLAEVATAMIVLWIGWHLWGRAAGAAGAFLWLSAPAVASRCEFTGINVVSTGTTAALLLAVSGMPALAGLAAGASIASGQHSAILAAFAGVIAAGGGLRHAIRFASAALAVVVVVFSAASALGGDSIWVDLVVHHAYHLEPEDGSGVGRLAWFLATVAAENSHLVLLAVATLVISPPSASPAVRFGKWQVRASMVIALGAILHVVTVLAMSGGQVLYLQPAMPLLACLAGSGAVRLGAAALREARELKRGSTDGRLVILAVLAIVSAVATGWAFSSEAYGRRDGRSYSFLPHRRFAEMAAMTSPTVASKVADQVRHELPAGGTIFGHPTIVDLVALETGAKVSAELADLAPRWINNGTVSRAEVVARIEADQVEHFITPAWFYLRDPFFADYLRRCYDQPTTYPREHGSGIPRILVFRHRSAPRPCFPDGDRSSSGQDARRSQDSHAYVVDAE
jgi:hypothetical protein